VTRARSKPALAPDNDRSLPLCALVGRPNVGKSSLFNRLVGGRPALVEDVPGVTRDRRYGACDWDGARFRVVDTGGLDPSAEGILKAMRAQTLRAVDEAKVIVFVVDALEGMTAVDEDVARVLRRAGKPVIVAANKIDSGRRESTVGEAFGLGFDQVFGISASHGRGIGELLDAMVKALGPEARIGQGDGAGAGPRAGERPFERRSGRKHHREEREAELAMAAAAAARAKGQAGRARGGETGEGDADADGAADVDGDVDSADDDGGTGEGVRFADADDDVVAEERAERAPTPGVVRLAFVGKPNVGKSSLVNRLLGEERVLVHDAPGTTRDPIDTPFSYGGREFVLVDTAGLRRRKAIDTLTEHVAAKMARDQIERCDVAALVIDARQGATSEDAKLARLIEDSGCASLLILNKKHLVGRAEIDKKIAATREELGFMAHSPVLLTSAVTAAGVSAIPAAAARVAAQAARRIPTGQLNQQLEQILAHHPPPAGPAGRHVRLYYATQASSAPPTFFISTNQPSAIGYAYRRFLVNQLRKAYGFEGAPIRIVLRAHKQRRRAMPKATAD
jgi:GTP-binding protein